MKERGRSGGSGRIRRQGFSKMGACMCPKCGYRQKHVQGSPCRMMRCPQCGATMMNEAVVGQTIGTSKPSNRESYKKKDTAAVASAKQSSVVVFPQVDAALCLGCGLCVDVCPQDAISLKDGAAFIDEDRCKNCRLCVSKCPAGAIA